MARTVRHARLESRTSRSRLPDKDHPWGRQPFWQALIPGRAHLGYQKWKGDREGRWILRRFIGGNKYRVIPLGRADDADKADGQTVLSYEQAISRARGMVDSPAGGKIERLTVRQALSLYQALKEDEGRPVGDIISRGGAHILPVLGDLVVSELTPDVLRRWLANLAAAPAQTRPKAGKPQYYPAPETDEDVRRRRASANRVLSILKAALNHAYDAGHIANRDAWGRKLRPFRDVEVARIRYLTVAEATRLINGADPDFRPLVRAALETGCRYGELTRLECHDFNADGGTITIRKSKTSKMRHVVLTDAGKTFFKRHCAGRAGSALMFAKADGTPWQKSEQGRPLKAALERAKIKPRITFHGLRHTWASLAAMNGVPLLIIAKNLGHANTIMVEKHYGHLAPSYIADAIRAGAPKYRVKADKKVVALR